MNLLFNKQMYNNRNRNRVVYNNNRNRSSLHNNRRLLYMIPRGIYVKPVIVCVAKFESDYIEEFVKYHLSIGFDTIYIYDNEDIPTYASLLSKYSNRIVVIHKPNKPVQYEALRDFVVNYMNNNNITHVAHIDVDEFITLKKHTNIKDFIREYIVGNCAGIGMNWRFFGSSGHIEKTNAPLTERFTMCEVNGNPHIKTLFNVHFFNRFNTCHAIHIKPRYYNHRIKSTNGTIITSPFNYNIDFSVIQLNHYKCKTLPEYQYIRTRGYADHNAVDVQSAEEIINNFKIYDMNETQDLTACNFYKRIQ